MIHPGPCPRCGSAPVLRDSSYVYRREYGRLIWICPGWPACDHYVGCHPKTAKPLGPMADKRTRLARREAHTLFDLIWEHYGDGTHRDRTAAYADLSKALGHPSQVHMGESDFDTCKKISAWSRERLRQLRDGK